MSIVRHLRQMRCCSESELSLEFNRSRRSAMNTGLKTKMRQDLGSCSILMLHSQ